MHVMLGIEAKVYRSDLIERGQDYKRKTIMPTRTAYIVS